MIFEYCSSYPAVALIWILIQENDTDSKGENDVDLAIQIRNTACIYVVTQC